MENIVCVCACARARIIISQGRWSVIPQFSGIITINFFFFPGKSSLTFLVVTVLVSPDLKPQPVFLEYISIWMSHVTSSKRFFFHIKLVPFPVISYSQVVFCVSLSKNAWVVLTSSPHPILPCDQVLCFTIYPLSKWGSK